MRRPTTVDYTEASIKKEPFTESEIEAIEQKLVSQFNLRFLSVVKLATISPPTCISEVLKISEALEKVNSLADEIIQAHSTISKLTR